MWQKKYLASLLFALLAIITCYSAMGEARSHARRLHNPSAKCDLDDLQRCLSCDGLDHAITLNDPDHGQYYRGAFWNGLYAAYRLNCLVIGEKLLKHHANPNLGGDRGSFLVTLSTAWPHNREATNRQWVDLLQLYHVDSSWKNPYTGQSAKDIQLNDATPLDYPDIWKLLTNDTATMEGIKQ